MEAKAIQRYVRITPRKCDQVLELIRGKRVEQARDPRTSRPSTARVIGKVLKSAVANAVATRARSDVEDLGVKDGRGGRGTDDEAVAAARAGARHADPQADEPRHGRGRGRGSRRRDGADAPVPPRGSQGGAPGRPKAAQAEAPAPASKKPAAKKAAPKKAEPKKAEPKKAAPKRRPPRSRRRPSVGQKTNPIGLRLGIVKTWDSRWFARKDYAELLEEDLLHQAYLKKRLYQAGISKIIDRAQGRQGHDQHHDRAAGPRHRAQGRAGGQALRGDEAPDEEGGPAQHRRDQAPDLDAQLVAEHIAKQLEQRVSFRRAMKKAIASSMRAGRQGIRVACSGRLGGSEMARYETLPRGAGAAAHAARRHRFRARDRAHDLRHAAASRCGSSTARCWRSGSRRGRRRAARPDGVRRAATC